MPNRHPNNGPAALLTSPEIDLDPEGIKALPRLSSTCFAYNAPTEVMI